MKAAIICFTENGRLLAEQTEDVLSQFGWEVSSYIKSKYAESYAGSLSQWTKEHFSVCQLLVFIGAAGIAVRAIAPYVRDKRTDPAVLVMDEKGTFVIPLLSGHIGGANEVAGYVSEKLGAVPVFTTATDVNRLFAVDVFAKKNNLWISDMKLAKEVSASLLHGNAVYVTADQEQEGKLAALQWPKGLIFQSRKQAGKSLEQRSDVQMGKSFAQNLDAQAGKSLDRGNDVQTENVRIHLGVKKQPWLPENTLYLVPKAVTVGIGCKKNTSYETIRDHVCSVLAEQGILIQAVKRAATIDIKAHEEGLLRMAKAYGWELRTYSAEELRMAPGDYSASAFVSSVTGVDNVCERSARLASDMGRLIIEKHGKNGVTAACAVEDWSVGFE